MKKNSNNFRLFVATLVTVTLLVGGFIGYNEWSNNTFVTKDRTAKVLDDKAFADFESGKTDTMVIAIYKKTCPVCKKWQHKITANLSSQDNPVVYVDATQGLPIEVRGKFAPSVFKNAKTPYIIVVKDKSYNPIYVKRTDSKEELEELRSLLK